MGEHASRGHLSPMITFSAFRDRYTDDTSMGGEGATQAIARSLERIGWRSVREPTPEDLAGELVMLFAECAHQHRDVARLALEIASVLRDAGPLLDGGLPPVEAYLEAAEELLRHYVQNDAPLAPIHLM